TYACINVVFSRQPSALPSLRNVFAVNHPPFEAPRLVDDSFEQPPDRVGSERPLARDLPHVPEDVLLAIRLINLDAHFLFEPTNLADAPCSLVEQPDEHFVDAVDIRSQIV